MGQSDPNMVCMPFIAVEGVEGNLIVCSKCGLEQQPTDMEEECIKCDRDYWRREAKRLRRENTALERQIGILRITRV